MIHPARKLTMDGTQSSLGEVDSLYGPGTIAAWLLTTLSVCISWLFDTRARRNDTVSLNVVTALLLPIVAAAHLFYLLANLPVSIAEALISRDDNIQQLVAAFEAPLNVCETFAMLSLLLAVFCLLPWQQSGPKYKRLGLIMVAGVLSWAPENLLFFVATRKGVKISESILSRPYLFFVSPLIGSVWTFLAGCFVYTGGFRIIVWLLHRRRVTHHQPTGTRKRNIAVRRFNYRTSTQANLELEMEMDQQEDDALIQSKTRAVTLMLLFYIPLSFAMALFSIYSIAYPKTKAQTEYRGRRHVQAFFIPNSPHRISAMDQALALSTGCLVLLYALVSAWRSRSLPVDPPANRVIRRRRSI